ncbi:MAG: formate/nitrite transporter family protein [Dorea sp.]|nr:formate/nitrite transporter family protein [Dorea sp.]
MGINSPAEIAKNYVNIGKGKVNTPVAKMFLLAVLAGAFIAVGGVSSTAASVGIPIASVAKFVAACVFPGGLTMVLIAGSELFTGNNLLVIPLLQKEVTVGGVLKNWVVVYCGNFVGSILVAAAAVFSHQASLYNNGMAVSMISTAAGKCALPFTDALIKGIMCNFLVCIAVWMSFAAKDVVSKFFALFFPIMMFVVAGFEHSVANMYYISSGIFAKGNPAYLQAAVDAGVNVDAVNWGNMFISNLLPVTIGNIIGGAVCVGCVYWFIYLKDSNK